MLSIGNGTAFVDNWSTLKVLDNGVGYGLIEWVRTITF